MMKRTLLNEWTAILFITMCLLLIARGSAFAVEAQLIKIQPVGEDKLVGFYLDPPVLKIEKNTIVIWLSGIQGADIQIVFLEGKTCKDVTANPGAFKLNEKSCFVTSFMGFGETSTLQFMESGNYSYYVATATGEIKARGTIVVR